jgi:hypothetical protein
MRHSERLARRLRGLVMIPKPRLLAAVLAASLVVLACGAPRSPAGATVAPPSIDMASPAALASIAPTPATPLPGPSELPLSTAAPIPRSDSFDAGLLYTCGSKVAFPIELLETPPSTSLNPDPTPALTRWPVPTTADAWWLLARTETRAEYLGLDAETGFYESAMLERDAKGTWNAVGWGGCGFYGVAPGDEETDVLGWWIRDRDWPQPEDRTLHIRVRTLCPGRLRDRILEPIVRYGPDRIIAMVVARPMTQEGSSCPEDQVADATIQLDEPVGYRQILDVKQWPGRDAHIKTDTIGRCCG